MPYTRIWIHFIWSTKERLPLLANEVRGRVISHIRVNAVQKGICIDTIGGYHDHLHALIRLRPDQSVSKVAQLIKGESSHWINKEKIFRGKFEWQEEYIALSVDDSRVEGIRQYILRQEEHHRKKSFGEEYSEFLKNAMSTDGLKPNSEEESQSTS